VSVFSFSVFRKLSKFRICTLVHQGLTSLCSVGYCLSQNICTHFYNFSVSIIDSNDQTHSIFNVSFLVIWDYIKSFFSFELSVFSMVFFRAHESGCMSAKWYQSWHENDGCLHLEQLCCYERSDHSYKILSLAIKSGNPRAYCNEEGLMIIRL